MNRSRLLPLLAALCLSAFAAVCIWQQPGLAGSRLTPVEVEAYLAKMQALNAPEPERSANLARIRDWALADDGQPFYMLNLMRYHPTLRRWPGAPEFAGTPQQSNAYYEAVAKRVLLRSGAYPLIGGEVSHRDLLDQPAALDDWSRALVVRYPNRRAFLALLTDPEYIPVMPYKLMALDTVLVPVRGDLVIPDLRLIAGLTLLALFLGCGWWQSSRRDATAG